MQFVLPQFANSLISLPPLKLSASKGIMLCRCRGALEVAAGWPGEIDHFERSDDHCRSFWSCPPEFEELVVKKIAANQSVELGLKSQRVREMNLGSVERRTHLFDDNRSCRPHLQGTYNCLG